MKGRKLNIEQKHFLKLLGVDPGDFLYLSKDFESYTFIHRKSNKQVCFRR